MNDDILYLNSEAVGVFPTTGRPQKDPLGRLTTEYNLTSLINTLLDVDGFVITNNISGFDDNNSDISFQFNIKGYIFTIHNLKNFLSSSDISNFNNIYASIKIKLDAGSSITSTGDKNLQRIQSIVGVDVIDDGPNKGKYTGLGFSNGIPGEEYCFLHILKYDSISKKWYIPEDSKIKLKTSTSGDDKYRSVSIDDGVIE